MRNSRLLNLTSAPAAPRGVPQAGREYPATLYLDDAMLSDVLPIIRRRLSETRHVDLTPRVHWTAKVALIAFAIASTLLVVTQ